MPLELDSTLVIGSGGREHAIAWSLSHSPRVKQVYCAPGNGGTADMALNVDLDIGDPEKVHAFLSEKNIGLTVIGPEAPLVAGLADALRAKGHLVVGASQRAAQLEGSKIFAKNFMSKYGIPTAPFRVFDMAEEAKAFARTKEGELYRVLKADGLAAGKGVVVAQSTEEVMAAISRAMEEQEFGEAGRRIILEKILTGPEVSLMAFTDGKSILPLPASQDHKRIYEDEKGPNTGGMGAYAPTPFYDDSIRTSVNQHIIENFLNGLKAEGLDFRGVIYFGLMLTPQGPYLLEFNVRLGDPETQAVLPLLQSDLYEVFVAVAQGNLAGARLELKPGAACSVVLASKGYPASYETGFLISGLKDAERPHCHVFQAGTKRLPNGTVTNGGRVMNVTGYGKTLEIAIVRAYQGVKRISFKNMVYRQDIGSRALAHNRAAPFIRRMKERQTKQLTSPAAP